MVQITFWHSRVRRASSKRATKSKVHCEESSSEKTGEINQLEICDQESDGDCGSGGAEESPGTNRTFKAAHKGDKKGGASQGCNQVEVGQSSAWRSSSHEAEVTANGQTRAILRGPEGEKNSKRGNGWQWSIWRGGSPPVASTMRRTRITDEESRTNESPWKSKNRRANDHPSDGAEFAREFGHKAVPGVARAGEQEHDAASQMQTLYLRAREDAQARVHARIRRTTQPTAGGKYFHCGSNAWPIMYMLFSLSLLLLLLSSFFHLYFSRFYSPEFAPNLPLWPWSFFVVRFYVSGLLVRKKFVQIDC
ncbi:unnamed protein product [Cylindrotheca closterium]|uniref:Uncharacterized protein n=1 Tax=Cylindrotheca closterium TaxID=2856 RepID=A0AAD2FH17_9STRA|nr:unnamed protein product [Cylindrotheca closterium]